MHAWLSKQVHGVHANSLGSLSMQVHTERSACSSLSRSSEGKKIASAVREAGVFRHNGGTIEGPFKPLGTIVL